MIEKLEIEESWDYEKLADKINEIIDEIEKINLFLKTIEIDEKNQLSSTDLLAKHEQQDWQPNEMQNGFVEEKKVDKLEEARKYNYTMFDIHYLRNEDLEKLLYDTQDQTFICLGEYLEHIKLFQQAIEQIIKEKDEEIKKWIKDRDNWFDRFDKLNRKQLKQKNPPEECIESIKQAINYTENNLCQINKRYLEQLLKYFMEL